MGMQVANSAGIEGRIAETHYETSTGEFKFPDRPLVELAELCPFTGGEVENISLVFLVGDNKVIGMVFVGERVMPYPPE